MQKIVIAIITVCFISGCANFRERQAIKEKYPACTYSAKSSLTKTKECVERIKLIELTYPECKTSLHNETNLIKANQCINNAEKMKKALAAKKAAEEKAAKIIAYNASPEGKAAARAKEKKDAELKRETAKCRAALRKGLSVAYVRAMPQLGKGQCFVATYNGGEYFYTYN